VIDPAALLAHLTRSGFRDLAGTHLSARIPVSGALLNEMAVDALRGTTAPVRTIEIRPRAGDRFDALITVSWPFVPAMTVNFQIERQPQFPASPMLVLRWSFLGAVGAIASRLVASMDRLPPGVRLEGDRLLIDIPALAAHHPAIPFIRQLELHTTDGRAVVDVTLEIPG
jgi:hypothetical protein